MFSTSGRLNALTVLADPRNTPPIRRPAPAEHQALHVADVATPTEQNTAVGLELSRVRDELRATPTITLATPTASAAAAPLIFLTG